MKMTAGTFQKKWLSKLVQQSLLTEEQSQLILSQEAGSRDNLFVVLIKHNFVSERDLTLFLSKELGIPVVNPLNFQIAKEVLEIVPMEFVKRYEIIPISLFDRCLTVATSNPMDLVAWDDLASITALTIKPVLTTRSLILEAMKRFYSVETGEKSNLTEDLLENIFKGVESNEAYQFSRQSEAVDLGRGADDAPVIKIVNLMVLESIRRGASDLFIEPWEESMRIRCRVDGMLEEMNTVPGGMAQAIVSRIKVMSKLDIAEHRIPQDGRFKAKFQNREVDFRVSVIPTSHGEKICIRLLDKKGQTQTLDSLGFTKSELEKIHAAAKRPHGMILITGPTGSGKTTTLYSVLNFIHSPARNITTVEDPVEYQVSGINQVNVRESVGLTFASALRSILRQDPNVIMVGEIRDLETMDIAIKAALTGHLVLSTLHTNDAASSIVRMMNMGIEPFLITSSVNMVTAQRLVRKLCVNCKEPVAPNAQALKILKRDSPKGLHLFRSQGCHVCRRTGFYGRRVITEVLDLSPTVREMIIKRANADQIKRQARLEKMSTLRESGLQKVLEGETTIEEVMRITASDPELT